MNAEHWVAEYRNVRPRYEKLADKVAGLLSELLTQNNIKAEIEHRTKSVESFSEKIVRPGKAYKNPLEEVTDLAGLRLILRSLSDVDRAASLVNNQFQVDVGRSLNKLDQLDPDRFGYLSQHYIVKLASIRAA